MKRMTALLLAALACLSLWGCAPKDTPAASSQGDGSVSEEPSVPAQPDASVPEVPSKRDSIPFEEGQLYAVAYLGYQEEKNMEKVEQYLDSTDLPTHYVSYGEIYLVIPRYEDMSLTLLRNDIETDQSDLFYEEPNCGPFILQCNASDIFSDVTVRLTRGEESAEFSPYVSLKDGTVQAGEKGLNLSPEMGTPED